METEYKIKLGSGVGKVTLIGEASEKPVSPKRQKADAEVIFNFLYTKIPGPTFDRVIDLLKENNLIK